MKHIINKLAFEMECPAEEQAFEIRQKLSIDGQSELVEIIDNVCSKFVTENEWIRIDKLEIDLGELRLNQFEDEFKKLFSNKFERIIAERIAAIPLEKLTGSKQYSELELLEYFLLNGYLPWWADDTSLVPDVIISSIFKNQLAEIIEFFREHINYSTVWERASYQLEDDILAVIVQSFEDLRNAGFILELFFKIITDEIDGVIDDKKQLLINKLEKARKKFFKILVSNASIIFKSVNDSEKIKSVLVEMVFKEFASIDLNAELKNVLFGTINIINNLNKINKVDFLHETKSIVSISDDSQPAAKNKQVANSSVIVTADKTIHEGEPDKLIVRNAGIILLAPFLKTFFGNLGLLAENKWIDKNAQLKGLFLLKYLSTGETAAFEYLLILEKIICGIAPEEPVPKEIMLSENELLESGQLLESVIEHWNVLKNTSTGGLRETFLKRDGIIVRNETGWLLKIERKTVDVLLESIPWGFSTIMLPWNDYLIITEW